VPDIDPRTLEEIRNPSHCHLVPNWTKVSDLTVLLDGDVDHRIGSYCDAQLQRLIQVFYGTAVRGQASMAGGSQSLSAVLDIPSGSLGIPIPRRNDPHEFVARALGASGGTIQPTGFVGTTVDCLSAEVSILHSTFLILHYHARPEIFGHSFDGVRELFRRAMDRSLLNSDDAGVRAMVRGPYFFIAPGQVNGPIPVEQLRMYYDSSFDPGDGVLSEFPNRSVADEPGAIRVTIPYSASMRAVVRFPL
jgi:hypothetical protein